MIKLCGFRVSNYHNKVRIALLEKGVPYEEDATCFPSQDAAFLARTPMGKAPFLETEHGTLCESQVICEYIEDAFPEHPLYPRDPFARAKVREIVQVLDLHIELVARRLYGAAFFGGSASDEVKNEVSRDLAKGVRALAHLAKFAPFIAGPELTLADCTAVVHMPFVTMASQMILGKDPFADMPQIKPYLEMLGKRPHVARVLAERDEAFRQMKA